MAGVILDASAALAPLRDEPGANKVAGALDGARVSLVNRAEVVSYYAKAGSERAAIDEMLRALPIELVPIDQGLALSAGMLRAVTADAGLSLGDRFCLALAARDALPALTADRAEGGVRLAGGGKQGGEERTIAGEQVRRVAIASVGEPADRLGALRAGFMGPQALPGRRRERDGLLCRRHRVQHAVNDKRRRLEAAGAEIGTPRRLQPRNAARVDLSKRGVAVARRAAPQNGPTLMPGHSLAGGATAIVQATANAVDASRTVVRSRMFYVRAYPRESQEMVFDAHARANRPDI